MTAPILADLTDQVARTTSVMESACVAFSGVAARVQGAVDAALAGGATAQELAAAVQVEIDALRGSSDALAAAVVANS